MARGQQEQAKTNFKDAQGVFNTDSANANALYASLMPEFSAMAAGKPTPGTIAENTAAQQSVGGATAGAAGEGNLQAARTRNLGGFQPALDESVRSGQRQLSQDALGIKANEVTQGLAGEQGLYGANQQGLLAALGLGNQAVNAGTEAGQSGWFQNLTGLIKALGGAGSAAAADKNAFANG